MKISEHLDKDNLHHAYLIEGRREEILVEILAFVKSLGIETTGNADVFHISLDSFKIEDARNLKSHAVEKGFTTALSAQAGKKIFIISANSFLLEAQNSLLKMFEEPIYNTHFFLVVPDANTLLETLVSRFYLIKSQTGLEGELSNAEKFIAMSLRSRVDFIKELLAEAEEDSERNEIIALDSTRSKALKFLNALESVLHQKAMPKRHFDTSYFHQIFKAREFLRMPGSSIKTLTESVALVVPNF